MFSLFSPTAVVVFMSAAPARVQDDRPNILLRLGDEIGTGNISVVEDIGRVS